MSTEKVKVEGIRGFNRNKNAPEFVLGSLIITPKQLTEWLNANSQHITEYNGEKQLKISLLKSKDGKYINVQVDNFVPRNQ